MTGCHSAQQGGPDRIGRVETPLAEYTTLRHRYGVLHTLPQLTKLDAAVGPSTSRLRLLSEQLADIEKELRWLESEIESFDKGRELLLVGAINDLQRRYKEARSPDPISGFRLWDVRSDGLYGVKAKWNCAQMVARCLTTDTTDEVPHTDGRCGKPPCGVYATKDVGDLIADLQIEAPNRSTIAIGLVAMSGKVVEHQRGYRAAITDVLALAITEAEKVPLLTHDSDRIRECFSNPAGLHSWLQTAQQTPRSGSGVLPPSRNRIIEYLKEQGKKHSWQAESGGG